MLPGKLFRSFQYDWSLLRKFLTFTIMVAVIPILFLCVLIGHSTGAILEGEQSVKQESLQLYAGRVNFRLEMQNVMSNAIFTNLDLQNAMVEPIDTIADLGELNKKANESVLHAKYVLSSLLLNGGGGGQVYDQASVTIYTHNLNADYGSGYIHSITDVMEEPWYAQVMDDGGAVWSVFENGQGTPSLRIVRVMRHFETLDVIGMLRVELPLHLMGQYAQDSYFEQPGHTLALFDDRENVYVISGGGDAPGMDAMRSLLFSGGFETGQLVNHGRERYYLFSSPLMVEGWSVALIVEPQLFRQNANEVLIYALVALLLFLAAVVLVSVFIYKSIIQRMHELTDKIIQLSEDVYSPLVGIEGRDEIGVTDQALNEMVVRLRELIETEYRSRLENVTLRLNILQEQINPHLLYNTLGMIEWSARKSGQSEIQEITLRMIRFYRNALNTGETVTTLGQELQMVSDYIEIICFAYEMDIDVEMDIGEGLSPTKIVKLIIQPVVENAIIHGLRYAATAHKKLRVACKSVDDKHIKITVEDNGNGMDNATRLALLDLREHNKKSYGMASVIQRLRLFYADRYTLDIQSEPEQGTSIQITIQWKQD